MPRGEETRVWVSRRVLWVGPDAYPLQNIARAQARELKLKPDAKWVRWLGIIAILLLSGRSVIIALRTPHDSGIWLGVLVSLVVIWVGVSIIAIILRLTLPLWSRKYYSLIIETAGPPRTVLISTSDDIVTNLIGVIMCAIDDDTMVIDQIIMNFAGDGIFQKGDHNIGKVIA